MSDCLVTPELFLDGVGNDLAGDGTVNGIRLVTPTLGHVLIFPGLNARTFICNTEEETKARFPPQLPEPQFLFHSLGK
jgi:hypothetical protein